MKYFIAFAVTVFLIQLIASFGPLTVAVGFFNAQMIAIVVAIVASGLYLSSN